MACCPNTKASPTPTACPSTARPKTTTWGTTQWAKISTNPGISPPTWIMAGTTRQQRMSPTCSRTWRAISRCPSLSVSHFWCGSRMNFEINNDRCRDMWRMLRNTYIKNSSKIIRRSGGRYWSCWIELLRKIKGTLRKNWRELEISSLQSSFQSISVLPVLTRTSADYSMD